MTEPIDLDAIRNKSRDLATATTVCPQQGDPCTRCAQRAHELAGYVPALLAEVEQLRDKIERRRMRLVDLARAVLSAIAGEDADREHGQGSEVTRG